VKRRLFNLLAGLSLILFVGTRGAVGEKLFHF